MERDDGEAHASAGQDCPALKRIPGTEDRTNEKAVNAENLRFVHSFRADWHGMAVI
jgi:hypothetical protein